VFGLSITANGLPNWNIVSIEFKILLQADLVRIVNSLW